MAEQSQNLTPEQDADIKYEKLCEIVKDIEVNGTGGEQFPRQAVISAIVASDNEILYKRLEDALFEQSNPELMRTMAAGFLMQKGRNSILAKYTKEALKGYEYMDETLEDKGSLIIAADALINSVSQGEQSEVDESLPILVNLYNVACHNKSTALTADKLLQVFINTLGRKSKVIDDTLSGIIKNKEAEINSRLVAVDILARSMPKEFYSVIEDIILNLNDYANNADEQIYFLDVATKAVNAYLIAGLPAEYTKVVRYLADFKFDDIRQDTSLEPELFEVLLKRTKNRIKNITENFNSKN